MKPLQEELISDFNEDVLAVTKPGPIKVVPNKLILNRSDELDLELTVVTVGRSAEPGPNIAPGTIYVSDEVVELSSRSGARYQLIGLVQRGHRIRSSAVLGEELNILYSLHAVEMRLPSDEGVSFVIEWVGNLPTSFIGNSNMKVEDGDSSEITIGDGERRILINRSNRSHTGTRIIQLEVDGIRIYILSKSSHAEGVRSRDGFIAYVGDVPSDTREKLRDCISFILGRPVVLFGHSEYNRGSHPLRSTSVSASTFGGAVFRVPTQPPYPVTSNRYRNMIDGESISNAVTAIFVKYDELRFRELSWNYWNGVSAPISMSAVYFGGLIERLQRVARGALDGLRPTLMAKEKWEELRRNLIAELAKIELEPGVRQIVLGKMSGLNQAPQSVVMDQLFSLLNMEISEAETSAWRDRNIAAHGGISSDYEAVILNGKLLRLIFHRLVAAMTGCSASYYDYYNYHFPVRPISQAIPARERSGA